MPRADRAGVDPYRIEGGMSQVQPRFPGVLSDLLEPIGRFMPVEFARELSALRATPEVQARIDELADKCNEGGLTDEERAEYEAYVDAIDVISILQAQARSVLARRAHD
jgi:hypothetical protein